ncbi:flagellin [Haloprofundus halophilus]|uniref:flagellin n=1 Tax=Haloprofundus halophilus TaxID=2283527 RepID=UPI000E44813F|nr:flagellin [Haloprofundus halophilus]
MGFSTSAAATIIFIGVLLSFGFLYPVVEQNLEAHTEAFDDRDDRSLTQRNTDIAFDSATYYPDTETLVVSVNNTGTTTLRVDETDLLVDGEIRTGYDTEVDDGPDRTLWVPGETLTMTVDDVAERPDRVNVVTGLGVRISTSVEEGTA